MLSWFHLPGWGEERPVNRSETREAHKYRDNPWHWTQVFVTKILRVHTTCQSTQQNRFHSHFTYLLFWLATVNHNRLRAEPLLGSRHDAMDDKKIIKVLKPQIRAPATTHHSHSIRVDHLLRAKCGEISQVGQNIHSRHYRQRDDDGAREVPMDGRVTGLGIQIHAQHVKNCRKVKPAILTYKAQSSPLWRDSSSSCSHRSRNHSGCRRQCENNPRPWPNVFILKQALDVVKTSQIDHK